MHQSLKTCDYDVYASNHSDEPSHLLNCRRLRCADTKKKVENENYFDGARCASSHVINNPKWIAEYFGITPPKTDDKRRVTFSCQVAPCF